jgi:Tol biopolymer transport system component
MQLAMPAQALGSCLAVALATCALARAQTTVQVDLDSAGVPANQQSVSPSISADGRYVAFESVATNLVPGDTNAFQDIFVRDVDAGLTTRVSVGPAGLQADGSSRFASISADGRWIAFASAARNLVPGDTNNSEDVFVHDRASGVTTRVSVDSSGAQVLTGAGNPWISGDGRFVAFESSSPSLVADDTNGSSDVFVHDRQTGATTRVSLSPTGRQVRGNSGFPSLSRTGRHVAFVSASAELVEGDTNGFADVFVHDRATGATTRVSISSQGAQTNTANSVGVAPLISADGRRVLFGSSASNLVAGDTNAVADVFLHDRSTGATTRVSVGPGGAQANETSVFNAPPALSADGTCAAFRSLASNLVFGDTNSCPDVFVHDLASATTRRASVDPLGGQLGCNNRWCALSGDGLRVVFSSTAPGVVPGGAGGPYHLYLRDAGPGSASCFADGSGAPCPCGNTGALGRGCQNSAGTGGAVLTALGQASLANDQLVLTAWRELPNALGILAQGDAAGSPVSFGDGLRCLRGQPRRLSVTQAVGGVVTLPQPGSPSISALSAALADPIAAGSTRHYQAFYRDTNLAYCPSPAGGALNASNAVSIVWRP